jgi:hypothetical protein
MYTMYDMYSTMSNFFIKEYIYHNYLVRTTIDGVLIDGPSDRPFDAFDWLNAGRFKAISHQLPHVGIFSFTEVH